LKTGGRWLTGILQQQGLTAYNNGCFVLAAHCINSKWYLQNMKKLLIPFFIIGTIAMIIVMSKTGKPLKSCATPSGIVNLELAYTTTKVNKVFTAWQINTPSSKITDAKTNTYCDFVFIFFYTGLLFLSCRTFYNMYKEISFFYSAGKLLAKAVLVAATLDVIENLYMLKLLAGNVTDAYAVTGSACALLKFILLILAVIYILISLVLSAFAKHLKPAGV
jgi:preprotein translocase subunit SecG